jgi:hypothetical protein
MSYYPILDRVPKGRDEGGLRNRGRGSRTGAHQEPRIALPLLRSSALGFTTLIGVPAAYATI